MNIINPIIVTKGVKSKSILRSTLIAIVNPNDKVRIIDNTFLNSNPFFLLFFFHIL